MFLKLFQNPMHGIHMWLVKVFIIDQNIVQIENNKDV